MTRVERELKAAEKELARHSHETQALWKKAQDDDDREPTPEERDEILAHVKAIETLKARKAELQADYETEQEVKRVGIEIGAAEPLQLDNGIKDVTNVRENKSLGELFVESEGFKSIQDKRGQQFSSGVVDISTKGTLLAGTLSPGSGSGGGLLAPPQVQPGVVDILFQRLTVADILPSGQIDSNTLRYMIEGTATNAAAGVAEGGTKPESTLGVGTRDEQVKKIATTLTVSDEMLEDAAAVQSYINARLGLFVKIEEERQLLRGSTANEVPGIIGRSGVNTYARGTVDSNAVALFKAMNGTRGSSLLEPDYIIMHPDNWQTSRLATDTAGQFMGGGPFLGPYGNGSVLSATGQVTGAQDTIWNKPVIVTQAIGSGTALLGAFGAAAQLFRKSGLSLEASNSHASYFTSDLVAIRAEERLALAVYRPSAFVTVTGLS